ncbi:hypothetical protein E1293_37170 [Actinomadura darangshiensis]|uniref:Uncharacterized protein n=1 Tax=Actinomadura darangshiensis TaxID=705336 RepID=A0A4R5A8C5_9ACTN|nr:hypothetical protein E1293_37170 [Actinomadura darangshiensis]
MDEEIEPGAAPVDSFGIGVLIPDKVDDREEGYRTLFDEAAACSGGSVVIDDVELIEIEDGDEYLHFRRNGRSIWWEVDHRATRSVDVQTFGDFIGDLAPDDGREFFLLDSGEGYYGWHLLLTPGQADALREEFDLPLSEHGSGGIEGPQLSTAPDTHEWYVEWDRYYMNDESRRFLDMWITGMDEALELWRGDHLPDGFPFDFTPESLHALEQLVLDGYAAPDAVERPGDEFIEGAIRYMGETAVRSWPSRWAFEYGKSETDSRIKALVVRANTPDNLYNEVPPLSILKTVTDKREQGLLHDLMDNVAYVRLGLARDEHGSSPGIQVDQATSASRAHPIGDTGMPIGTVHQTWQTEVPDVYWPKSARVEVVTGQVVVSSRRKLDVLDATTGAPRWHYYEVPPSDSTEACRGSAGFRR